jgi:hypothetical protein
LEGLRARVGVGASHIPGQVIGYLSTHNGVASEAVGFMVVV